MKKSEEYEVRRSYLYSCLWFADRESGWTMPVSRSSGECPEKLDHHVLGFELTTIYNYFSFDHVVSYLLVCMALIPRTLSLPD